MTFLSIMELAKVVSVPIDWVNDQVIKHKNRQPYKHASLSIFGFDSATKFFHFFNHWIEKWSSCGTFGVLWFKGFMNGPIVHKLCVGERKKEKQTNIDRSLKLNFKGFLHFHYFLLSWFTSLAKHSRMLGFFLFLMKISLIRHLGWYKAAMWILAELWA